MQNVMRLMDQMENNTMIVRYKDCMENGFMFNLTKSNLNNLLSMSDYQAVYIDYDADLKRHVALDEDQIEANKFMHNEYKKRYISELENIMIVNGDTRIYIYRGINTPVLMLFADLEKEERYRYDSMKDVGKAIKKLMKDIA